MKIWKKNAVLAIVILFVCVAVYLNWSYGRGESEVGDSLTGTEDIEETGSATRVGDIDTPQDSEAASTEEDGEGAEISEVSDTPDGDDYFSIARLNRQQARDSSLEILRESSGNDSLSQEARDKAAQELSTLASYAMSEAQIESLVIAKGFSDCVAFINDGGIEVVVPAMRMGLQAEQVTQIKDIVVDETGIAVGQIKIIEVNE